MKTIKFRVWDKKIKQWIEYGDIFIDEEGEVYLIEERTWAYQSYMHKENITEQVEIMQYTGLKDKNGKEIYEGDLIKKKFKDREIGEFYAVGQVVFGHWYAGFTVPYNYHGYNKLERLSNSCDKDGWVVANRDMEVIGNIYENPELTEG